MSISDKAQQIIALANEIITADNQVSEPDPNTQPEPDPDPQPEDPDRYVVYDPGSDGQPEVIKDANKKKEILDKYVAAVASTLVEYPNLRPYMLAQAFMEAGYGDTILCQQYNNWHGMKWRDPAMRGYATPVMYYTDSEPSGKDVFCRFDGTEDEVRGYWKFLDRSPYAGWRNHVANGADFLEFIGKVWCPPGYTQDWANKHSGLHYHEYIIKNLLPRAKEELLKHGLEFPDDQGRPSAPVYPGAVQKNGSKGDAVRLIQARLNARGYESGAVDGIFGNKTEDAVKWLQKDSGITVDGVVGPRTWENLFTSDEKAIPANRFPDNDPAQPDTPTVPGTVPTEIPFAIKYSKTMPTHGDYVGGKGPKGLIVHFTAGRPGTGVIDYGIGQGYAYHFIDDDGKFYTTHPLDKWGHHAGTSSWPGLGSGVSDKCVGVEMACAGKCTAVTVGGVQRFKAWFHKTTSEYFTVDQVRYVNKLANMEAGWYHKYTPGQEKALIDVCVYYAKNFPAFEIDYILGHDEVAPGRKSDPGGSLSMTMPQLRAKIKELVLNQQPQDKRYVLHCVRKGVKDSRGNEVLGLSIHTGDFKAIQTINVVSGSPLHQVFRKGNTGERPGSYEPLMQGKWVVGDVSWAGGRNNYSTYFSTDGLGPVWIPITPQFNTDRSAFGIHLDSNRSNYPGTAGCIGITSIDDLKKLVSWFDNPNTAPKSLVCDWGLS